MMTRKVLLSALTGLLLAAFYQGVLAQRYGKPGNWILLGDSSVDGVRDHDEIKVGHADGRFKELQLRVQRAPIDFDHVIVHFAGGSNQELPVRHKIAAGGSTPPIDLRGNERVIESVEVWYTKAKWGPSKPKMLLYGR